MSLGRVSRVGMLSCETFSSWRLDDSCFVVCGCWRALVCFVLVVDLVLPLGSIEGEF